MKRILTLVFFLLVISLYPAFGDYGEPTAQEQDLYNNMLEEFENLSLSKKDVSDVLKSFDEPIVISFPCNTSDIHSSVNATITTKLVNFDDSLASHEGTITGGIYVWKCNVTFSAGKLTINCNNGIMLNSNALLNTVDKDPKIKQVEELVVFYHELLHGQLMIDAIKSSESWHHDACNKNLQDDLDYSYTDADHKIITPLQTDLASQLIKNIGGIFQVEEINPQETTNGAFTKKIGSLYDYPQYLKDGISISARSYNIVDIQIGSQKNDIMISGHLNNKSQSGIVWLYIFGKSKEDVENTPIQTQNEPTPTDQTQIPDWIKSNAKWWADGTIGDSDFVLGIQYLINAQVIKIPQTTQGTHSTQQIPSWIKNNAEWWADGTISDLDFIQGIQYLIKNGIMQIQTTNQSPINTAEPVASPKNLGSVHVNGDTFQKQPHTMTQIQISGNVDSFRTGTYVILTIINPDQSSYDLKGILTNKGQFTIPFTVDDNTQVGRYTVVAKYDNAEFARTIFNIH